MRGRAPHANVVAARSVDALVRDVRWVWAVALNRSPSAAEVHVEVALAGLRAKRKAACDGQTTKHQIKCIRMQLHWGRTPISTCCEIDGRRIPKTGGGGHPLCACRCRVHGNAEGHGRAIHRIMIALMCRLIDEC